MKAFSKNSKVLLVLGFIACFTLFINSASARANAGLWDEEDEDWVDWGENSAESSSGAPKTLDNTGHDPSSHPNHHDTVHTAGASGSSWDQTGGIGGGNLAAFNESCGPSPKKSCATTHELQCSSSDGNGLCVCTPGHTYVRVTEKCWLIPKLQKNECDHDTQCHAGVWGPLSRCNKHNRECECFDYNTGGKSEMKQVDGVCYIRKFVDQPCRLDEECDKTIEGEAYCKPNEDGRQSQNYNGTCACRETHIFWKAFDACLKKSTKLNDECKISEQCKEGSLGVLSRCSQDTARCECYSWRNDTESVYYDKLAKCFFRKQYNESCTNEDQCKASLGPDVECGVTEDSPDDKVCHCPKGKVCRSSAFSTILSVPTYTTLGLACTATAIGVSSLMNGMQLSR